MITNKDYNVDLANLSDKKLMYVLAEEMYFNEKALVNQITWEKSHVGLHHSPAIIASGIFTMISLENPDEFCDKLKL